ncbi:hypothetical protein ZIOFF_053583 [Zingiber officinale]|uniref:FAR1 domain-containing protein n=1 Tax=Zingiber officinale TaxID=94328 RepID=A0A8J5F875_ZINOF|nr:hypothetical protein ZIOFF_053583 [Zingiber officinale]
MKQERLIEGDFQVLGDSSSSNGVDTPQVGMCFSAEEEVRDFYKSYAQILGFGIAKLGSKKGDDGQLKYFSFGCSKNGKTAPRVKNSFYPRPCSKTDCKAKINITVQNDGSCSSTVDKKQDELSNMNSPSMIDDESSKNVSCDFTRLCTKAYAGEMELMTKEREYAGFMFMTFRHFLLCA